MRQHFFFNFILYRRINGPPWWLSGKESVCDARDPDSIPGLGRSPGEGNGNPLQYPCLENLMDRGAWWAIILGVTKSQTRLNPTKYLTECMHMKND